MEIKSRLTDYKENILTKLIESDIIVKLVSDNSTECLDNEITIDPTTLIYNNVFPYKKVLNAEQLKYTNSYITTSFRAFQERGSQIVAGKILFFVLIHESNIRVINGDGVSMRWDLVLEEIKKIFNGSRDFGIGKLQYDVIDEADIGVEDYVGHVIAFDVVDFK